MKSTIVLVYCFFTFVLVSCHKRKEFTGAIENGKKQTTEIDDRYSAFRISNGKISTIDKHPYLATVHKNGVLKGGAAILNNLWLVTAGYNVFYFNISSPGEYWVRVGSNTSVSDGITVQIDRVIMHPNYTGLWDYDIALIKLKAKLNFTKTVKAIDIGSDLPAAENTNTLVSGYGAMNYTFIVDGQLRESQVPYSNYTTCKKSYSQVSMFKDVSFCTKGKNGPCPSDFGDPLVFHKKLIGIFSGSFGCGDTSSRYPAVYADLTQLNTWIQQVIHNNHTQPFHKRSGKFMTNL